MKDSQTGIVKGPKPLRLRAVLQIIRIAGLVPTTIAYFAVFFIGSAIIAEVEPSVDGFGNAIWLMFQIITTIGFGDYTCTSAIGRVVVIILSINSVFYLALITGTVVSYCQERLNPRRDASVAHFLDQLERLPELSHEELVELSKKVKKFR